MDHTGPLDPPICLLQLSAAFSSFVETAFPILRTILPCLPLFFGSCFLFLLPRWATKKIICVSSSCPEIPHFKQTKKPPKIQAWPPHFWTHFWNFSSFCHLEKKGKYPTKTRIKRGHCPMRESRKGSKVGCGESFNLRKGVRVLTKCNGVNLFFLPFFLSVYFFWQSFGLWRVASWNQKGLLHFVFLLIFWWAWEVLSSPNLPPVLNYVLLGPLKRISCCLSKKSGAPPVSRVELFFSFLSPFLSIFLDPN